MYISYKQLILLSSSLIVFLPFHNIGMWLGVSDDLVRTIALIVIESLAMAALIYSRKKAKSKSLKLFWQFMLLAIFCSLINTLLASGVIALANNLTQDFASLFIYFFIFLAIETNPHLSDIPLNKYISGRVPIVIFIVVLFGYLILTPAEYLDSSQRALKVSALFHIIISSALLLRLFESCYLCKNKNWLMIYSMLFLSATFLLMDNSISLYLLSRHQEILTFDFNINLTLLPFFFLILATYFSDKWHEKLTPLMKSGSPERYILLLTFALFSIHFIGMEFDSYFITNSRLQSAILLLWLVIASTSIIFISQKRKKQLHILKTDLSDLVIQQKNIKLEKLNLEEKLINSEDKAIVAASNNAILTTSIKGQILSANPAAVQMFQSLEHELVGCNVSSLFSVDDEMHYFFNFQSNVYSLQRKEAGISIECISRRSDGKEFPAQAELQWAEREEQPLIVITFINLTARKLAEKQTLELKDKFIANISHEFRTPLTIINGIIDRYLINTHDQEERQDLTTAKRNGLRLVRMVEQLLELSRLTDNPRLSMSIYRLSSLLAMPIDSFGKLADQSHISFNSNIPNDIWCECDAQAFEKIIFNLLANAIKYTKTDGHVEINAHVEQDNIILDIIDTGIGIDIHSQGKIFERFQRADDTKNQATFGVGIGLSLVKELVKAHFWRINLVSEHHKGSKFTLVIPLAKPQTIELETPMSLSEQEITSLLIEQRSSTENVVEHSQKIVLVIEDNIDMQTHIKQVIEQQHHCILASSGELGIELALEFIPDIIVCDLMLTGIDGFEVLKEVKQNEITAHIPIILLTARSDLDSRLQGLQLNADEYLSKPFNQQELLTRIDNLIKNRQHLKASFQQKFEYEQSQKRKISSHENLSKLTQPQEIELSMNEKFLTKLEIAVSKHYAEPELGIIELSSLMAMSERQLQRKMKVLLGTTPNNYIKEFRLFKAQELLKQDTQIGRIAQDVGFSSQTYFGRCFKESFGCTPKHFQQQHQQNNS